MLGNEQEYLYKDFFILFAALFGLFVVIFIQLKHSGVRFRPIGRRKNDLENTRGNYSQNQTINYLISSCISFQKYEILLNHQFKLWQIGIFKTLDSTRSNLQLISGSHFLYPFSNSKVETEKLISPLFRKIVNKYKNKFTSEKFIYFSIEEQSSPVLYTWLKNESQIHTVIYNFLDECLLISNELKLQASMLIKFQDALTFEFILPFHPELILLEEDFKQLYGIDFIIDKEEIKLKLWVAFSQHKVPEACLKSNIKINLKTNRSLNKQAVS